MSASNWISGSTQGKRQARVDRKLRRREGLALTATLAMDVTQPQIVNGDVIDWRYGEDVTRYEVTDVQPDPLVGGVVLSLAPVSPI